MERFTKKEQVQSLCHSFHILLEQSDRLVKMTEIVHQIALIRNDKDIIEQLEFELYSEEINNPPKELIERRTAQGYFVPSSDTTETDYYALSREIIENNIPSDEEIVWTNSLIEIAKGTFVICDKGGVKFIVLKDDLFRYKIKLELMLKRYISSVVIELEKEEGVELGDVSGDERV